MALMRIFLPLAAPDRAVLETGGRLALAEDRRAWAVTAEARADRPGEDEEDLEYDALQDAVHIALSQGADDARALVIAADVPDAMTAPAAEEGGAFGVSPRETASARSASLHVTELAAAAR